MNTVFVEGNLTKAPELRQTAKGKHTLSFTVASNHGTAKDDSSPKEVWYANCVLWFDAEMWAGLLKQGTKVIATGRLKQESWDGRDGNKRYMDKLIVSSLGLSPKPNKAGATGGGYSPPPAQDDTFVPEDDDVPL